MAVVKGASGATEGAPPDPKWRHTGIPDSSQMRKKGSQWVVWNDGSPSA